MADASDRTIPATPRRRQAAREEGAAPNAALPAFVATAAAAIILLPGWSATAMPAAGGFLRESIAAAFSRPGDDEIAMGLVMPAKLLVPTAAVVLASAGACLGIRFLLDGSAWRLSRAAPRWRRIDPFAGVARVVSIATLRAVVWHGLCLAVLAAVAALSAGPLIRLLAAPAPLVEPGPVIGALRQTLVPGLAAAAAVAAAQWGVARLAFDRRLRMTPDEFKEEMRGFEADPKIKFERRGK